MGIDLHNYTPLVPTILPTRGKDLRDYWVVAIKGTFLVAPGERARLADAQQPFVMSDVHYGEPGKSSVLIEEECAPFKPRSDVIVRAVATAPGGRAARAWRVRLQVGSLDKTIRAFGPRAWVRTALGNYDLTDPEPCTEVPIRYERAYGGVWRGEGGEQEVLEENPIGVGFVPAGKRERRDVIIAPQLEDPADPIGKIGRMSRPQGLGPIARAWLPRRLLAGTPDETWLKERWPNLPLDFSDAYYNCAHPDLIYPGYLRGDEQVVAEHLGTDRLKLRLPAIQPEVMTLPPTRIPLPALDTMYLDLVERRLCLIWRTRFEHTDFDRLAVCYQKGNDGR